MYHGKNLSEWFDAYGKDDPAATNAIVAIGTNMIPRLLTWLDYRPSKFRTWIDDGASALPAIVADSQIVQSLRTDRAEERGPGRNRF